MDVGIFSADAHPNKLFRGGKQNVDENEPKMNKKTIKHPPVV